MQRREFLKTVGVASTATLATSCGLNDNSKKLIPYLVPPEEEILPGLALYRSSSCSECPAGCGVTAKIKEKVVDNKQVRVPVKLEGVENHPINEGALCIRGQTSLARLYHPKRIKTPLIKDENGNFVEANWEDAFATVSRALASSELESTRNVYLSGRTSGTLANLVDDFSRRMGIEKLQEYEFYSHVNIREANKTLFNADEIPLYKIEDADFLLSIGADLFETFVSPVSYAKQFARAKKTGNFEFYQVEPHVTTTGYRANERFTVKPESEVYLLTYLLWNLGNNTKNRISATILNALPNLTLEETAEKTGLTTEQISHLAEKLATANKPLLIAGGVSTSSKNGLLTAITAGLIQWAAGMVDGTVDFSRSESFTNVGTLKDMENLSSRLGNNEIGVIFFAGVDPVRTLPSGIPFKENLRNAKFKVAFAHLLNDTVNECDVVLPLSHSLESWGDVETRRGIVNVVQPVIEPLYDTHSEGDILLELMLRKIGFADEPTYQEYLLKSLRQQFGQSGLDELLNNGFIERPASSRRVSLNSNTAARVVRQSNLSEPISEAVLFVTPSLRSYDGRSRDLELLEEIPDTLSSISYGQWISYPRSGNAMGLDDRDEINVSNSEWQVKLPVKIQSGLRSEAMMIQRDLIKDAPLQVTESGDFVSYVANVSVEQTGISVVFPILSGQSMEHETAAHRNDLHAGKEEHSPEEHRGEEPDLYPKHEHKDYRWAMAIDLDLCTGCGACVAACHIENNVPIVGKKEHLLGREMSWIRIEARYGSDEKDINFQPMLCQHCGNAPCEPVCPVYATFHNEDGLNAQIYNRCVGTRYCANNCPYKVRRFNWFDFPREEPLNLMVNPDLLDRSRGVMEKCTFCVQRIRLAKDIAKDESRKVADGEFQTACQQTCPADAIVFGNLLDPESEVAKLSANGRGYHELEEIHTKPGVTYLRKSES